MSTHHSHAQSEEQDPGLQPFADEPGVAEEPEPAQRPGRRAAEPAERVLVGPIGAPLGRGDGGRLEHAELEVLEAEERVLNALNDQQRAVLRGLNRLHRSLRGPQDLLESAGNFNRPPFPEAPPRGQIG